MKLTACCCTFLRPHYLGELIESFQRQDYPLEKRELVILDDAGQYENQQGPGWQLISIPRRFATLGEKRNACIALASLDTEAFLIADDDDIYLPHWFSTIARALEHGDWVKSRAVYCYNGEKIVMSGTNGVWHSTWAIRKSLFHKVHGYSPVYGNDDQDLGAKLRATGIEPVDSLRFAPAYVLYRFSGDTYHASHVITPERYSKLLPGKLAKVTHLDIRWKKDYVALCKGVGT